MKHNKKLILLAFFIISTFFTFWYAVPFSFSRAGDARVARAFITDEADLCEIIIKSINNNEEFKFDAYGFFYYKSGIVILKVIDKVAVVSERTVLIFFRLYSWFYFLALVLVLTLLTYKLTGIYGAFFALALSFIASPNLLLYAAMLHPDVAQVFFIVLSLYWLYLFVSNRKNWYILLSAASAALAFSCKYSGVLLLPAIYTAIFFAKTNEDKTPDKLYLQNILSLTLLSLTFYFLNNSEISNHIGSAATGNEILF
ncbi:MAG: glycosyltransferase family 39 protein, partial [Bacteroidales bacterium]|nr:glycosyltransferase family 39 protein [Bacteroidales bacterium]